MDIFAQLPDTAVLAGADLTEAYRHDESHLVGDPPLAVVKPRSREALRALVALAKGEGFALVPRGAGTGKAGGCIPLGRSVVMDMGAWPGEIRVSRQDLALWAPASAMLRDVKAAALAQGLFYPPDPNSWDQCAFGGSLATNAGGPGACKYGMTRHWVLAVDALMADGEVHTFGIPSVKCNVGPSLGQLLVGSEGIFGLIVGATVRLLPVPRERLTLLLPMERWEALLDLPGQLVEAGYLPSAFEFWDPAVLADLRGPGGCRAKPWPCSNSMTGTAARTASWRGWWRPWVPWRNTSRPPRTRTSAKPCGPSGAPPPCTSRSASRTRSARTSSCPARASGSSSKGWRP